VTALALLVVLGCDFAQVLDDPAGIKTGISYENRFEVPTFKSYVKEDNKAYHK